MTLKYQNDDEKRFVFANTKKMVVKYINSSPLQKNVISDYNKLKQEREEMPKDEKAGKNVFLSAYHGIKEGVSFNQISQQLAMLPFSSS